MIGWPGSTALINQIKNGVQRLRQNAHSASADP